MEKAEAAIFSQLAFYVECPHCHMINDLGTDASHIVVADMECDFCDVTFTMLKLIKVG